MTEKELQKYYRQIADEEYPECEECKRLREENNDLKFILKQEGIVWKRCTKEDMGRSGD